MITTHLVLVFYDGASEPGAGPPQGPTSYASTAPPIGAFAMLDGYGDSGVVVPPPDPGSYSSTAPPLGAFSFINGYGEGPAVVITDSPRPGGSKRRRAAVKRIEHEKRIVKEYLESLDSPVAPVARVQAVRAVNAAIETVKPEHVPNLADVARRAVSETEHDFKTQYWARFVTLVINNIH